MSLLGAWVTKKLKEDLEPNELSMVITIKGLLEKVVMLTHKIELLELRLQKRARKKKIPCLPSPESR